MLLSFRVIDLRKSPVTRWLHPKNWIVSEEKLLRAIRGHANFAEYTPLFLILLLLCENIFLNQYILFFTGTLFTLGRIIHAVSFCFLEKPRLWMRILGTALTFTSFIILIITALLYLIFT